jgi:ABC-type cobalamin/Fe3+-siderophores transport system ATPase subunit
MIEISQLTFVRGDQTVLSNISATIPSRGITLITGPNGAGKTTLLNLIGGVLKPQSGKIAINGKDVSHLKIIEQSRVRSIAPQKRIFDLAFSVSDLLKIVRNKDRNTHQEEIIESLGLVPLMNKRITELSLGQQQRVNVALCLIRKSDFYLLDEPTSAQDGDSAQALISLCELLAKECGVAIISHHREGLHNAIHQISLSGH